MYKTIHYTLKRAAKRLMDNCLAVFLRVLITLGLFHFIKKSQSHTEGLFYKNKVCKPFHRAFLRSTEFSTTDNLSANINWQ